MLARACCVLYIYYLYQYKYLYVYLNHIIPLWDVRDVTCHYMYVRDVIPCNNTMFLSNDFASHSGITSRASHAPDCNATASQHTMINVSHATVVSFYCYHATMLMTSLPRLEVWLIAGRMHINLHCFINFWTYEIFFRSSRDGILLMYISDLIASTNVGESKVLHYKNKHNSHIYCDRAKFEHWMSRSGMI